MSDSASVQSENETIRLSARDIASALARGDLSAGAAAAAFRARIEAREAEVGAWQVLDWDFVDHQVAALGAIAPEDRGPLHGVPVAVKDVFDTADLPTAYGSEIYEGFRPAADAAAVARLRAAGAVVLGKTVSTEFAYWKPGKTCNPLDPTRSPGGSSSGSAAAVADRMAPIAIGSQTAASTIRPASYCGIVGFKPTRGAISLAGAKALANSLDHVGLFARSVTDVALPAAVLMGDPSLAAVNACDAPPRVAVRRAPEWKRAEAYAVDAVTRATSFARGAGADVAEELVDPAFADLAEAQTLIMAVEATRELAHERRVHLDRLSQPLRDLFAEGEAAGAEAYAAACARRDASLAAVDELFGAADFLLAPSTCDEAPLLTAGTGDPVMCRAWTLLGLPSITLPCGTGPNGLPLGLQIAARPRDDRRLLAAARWFETVLGMAGD